MAVERFRDEHFFLSSMYEVKGGIEIPQGLIEPTLEDIIAVTVEHPYQASKFEDADAQAQVLTAPDGFKAKKIADRLKEDGSPVRPDWNEVKLDIMRALVQRKFSAGTRLAHLLLNTGEEELVEGNTWNDTFWGVCPPGSRNGLNWLGRILMETRQSLRESEPKKQQVSK